jgi:dienelactone hydrolase
MISDCADKIFEDPIVYPAQGGRPTDIMHRLASLIALVVATAFATASAAQPYGWPCSPECIDAGVHWDADTRYLFKGAEYIAFSGGEPEDGYPRPIAGNWKGFPPGWTKGIDAAVSWGSGRIYFFRGNRYIRYEVSPGGAATYYDARPIASWGFPAAWQSGIDGGIRSGNKAYFFKGDQYLRYDVATERVDSGFPRPIAGNWPGFPPHWSSGIDAAVDWGGGRFYFFKEREYLRYDASRDGGFRHGALRSIESWSIFEELPRSDLNEAFARVPTTVTGLDGVKRTGDMIVTHFRPSGQGPFPAVIYSHGRRPYHRAWPARYREAELASFWVQRGFAFFYATRLGYGATGLEPDVESAGGVCKYAPGVDAVVTQLGGVVRYAQSLSFVDQNRILLVGNSTGGLATIAATGRPPRGVVAAVNFSGGAGGGITPGRPCNEPEIRRLITNAGRSARTPMLWLYAANDSLWGPQFPREWHAAYVKSGGRAHLHIFPSVGSDGHNLKDHIEVWAPVVTDYLPKLGFMVRNR